MNKKLVILILSFAVFFNHSFIHGATKPTEQKEQVEQVEIQETKEEKIIFTEAKEPTLLWHAASCGEFDRFEEAFTYNPKHLYETDKNGNTVLHIGMQSRKAKFIASLLLLIKENLGNKVLYQFIVHKNKAGKTVAKIAMTQKYQQECSHVLLAARIQTALALAKTDEFDFELEEDDVLMSYAREQILI